MPCNARERPVLYTMYQYKTWSRSWSRVADEHVAVVVCGRTGRELGVMGYTTGGIAPSVLAKADKM
jgi:hypothetical protein